MLTVSHSCRPVPPLAVDTAIRFGNICPMKMLLMPLFVCAVLFDCKTATDIAEDGNGRPRVISSTVAYEEIWRSSWWRTLLMEGHQLALEFKTERSCCNAEVRIRVPNGWKLSMIGFDQEWSMKAVSAEKKGLIRWEEGILILRGCARPGRRWHMRFD